MTTIAHADILSAFSAAPVGSKVTDPDAFTKVLVHAIERYDFDAQRIPGQGFIVLPEAIPFVSAGDGPRTTNPEDFTPALHRGQVGLFLKREHAGATTFCAAVVYTREAYANDPEVDADELERIGEATHVLVAVIASSGPAAPLTPERFVANLAGGNREALAWNADEIRSKAAEVNDYWSRFAVVAG